ncbi:hypothetical protein PR003_g8000 [Phytophthora rubi]|uniref:Uncharacterized protein n=1 Tax=Phytophthora rubi TaxID=129364 RepID=A0A6A3NR79_9STRA|nr:hypothetical protein PR001_g5688 [Phytophthora rubi]KAE9345329.1 hypothetical protein PR003_g8000 [Phytophthora rubi]
MLAPCRKAAVLFIFKKRCECWFQSQPASPAWLGPASPSSCQGWPPESQSEPASNVERLESSLHRRPLMSQSALEFRPRSSEQEPQPASPASIGPTSRHDRAVAPAGVAISAAASTSIVGAGVAAGVSGVTWPGVKRLGTIVQWRPPESQ